MLEVTRSVDDSNLIITKAMSFNEEVLLEGKKVFEQLIQKKIILNSSFDDLQWILSNEKSIKKLIFEFDELSYNKEASYRNIGCYEEFIQCVKVYLLFLMDKRTIDFIYSVLAYLKHLFNETHYFNNDYLGLIKKGTIIGSQNPEKLVYALDIIEFYDMEISEQYLIILYCARNNVNDTRINTSREVPDFDNMFKFSEVMDYFWESANDYEKEKYYPIKLWWEITTIIPLRPNEFILTPYDCNKVIDGKYYIEVRRTELKGNKNKKVTQKIDYDYRLCPLQINKRLYDLIEEYKNVVDKYDHIQDFYGNKNCKKSKRLFLLSYRSYFNNLMHFGKINNSIKSMTDFFTNQCLSILLGKFCEEIVYGKFNYEIIMDKDKELRENQIEFIRLMDTRHFAFMNLVLNDVEPMMIKQIGGHADIRSSFHYYNHLDQYVKCYTYSMARRMAVKKQSIRNVAVITLSDIDSKRELIYSKFKNNNNYRLIKGGKCFYTGNDFEPCFKADNIHELCEFFLPDFSINEQRINDLVDANSKEIEKEINSIILLLKTMGKIPNNKENYDQKIIKIKSIVNQNASLISKYLPL